MPIRLPTRREPRVLALSVAPKRVAFAVVDPWEIRSTGTFVRPRSLPAAIRRLARREKPTVVVTSGISVGVLAGHLDRLGVEIRNAAARRPPAVVARQLYPELAWFAPTPALDHVTRAAIGHVLRSPITPRRYAHRSRRPAVHTVRVSSAR